MKQVIIALVASSLVLTSCSKDPEKVLPRKDGKWKITGTAKDSDEPAGNMSVNGTITFNDNNTYTFNYTATVSGAGTITDTETGKWSATDNSVSLGNEKYEVTEKKRKSEKWKQVDGTTIVEFSLTKE